MAWARGIWERRVTLVGTTTREPILPWRFRANSAMVGTLL